MSTVLVTGGSGFIASHTILQLLAAGHKVRTTVRNLSREGEVRAMLRNGGSGLRPAAASMSSSVVAAMAQTGGVSAEPSVSTS